MAGTSRLPSFLHVIEPMDPGGGFLGNPFPFLYGPLPEGLVGTVDFPEQPMDNLEFLVVRGHIEKGWVLFGGVSLMDQKGGVSAVVHDELRGFAVRPGHGLQGAPPVFLQGFTLPGEDRDAVWAIAAAA
jgi:hypothetical protein